MSTYRLHARIAKKIINFDRQAHNVCCWDDCERDSISLYVELYHHHPVGRPCGLADRIANSAGDYAHQRFAFCSERHQAYFRNSGGWRALAMIDQQGRAYGNLPTGSKNLPL